MRTVYNLSVSDLQVLLDKRPSAITFVHDKDKEGNPRLCLMPVGANGHVELTDCIALSPDNNEG